MGDLALLITAIGSALAAVIGAVGGLVVAVRRISPHERTEAASSADQEQDRRLQELQDRIDELTRDEGAT